MLISAIRARQATIPLCLLGLIILRVGFALGLDVLVLHEKRIVDIFL